MELAQGRWSVALATFGPSSMGRRSVQPGRTLSCAAEAAFVVALYLWTALPLVPYMTPLVPAAYVLAVLLQRRRPAILVLRRFGLPEQDADLVQSIAPAIVPFARIWWLGG